MHKGSTFLSNGQISARKKDDFFSWNTLWRTACVGVVPLFVCARTTASNRSIQYWLQQCAVCQNFGMVGRCKCQNGVQCLRAWLQVFLCADVRFWRSNFFNHRRYFECLYSYNVVTCVLLRVFCILSKKLENLHQKVSSATARIFLDLYRFFWEKKGVKLLCYRSWLNLCIFFTQKLVSLRKK